VALHEVVVAEEVEAATSVAEVEEILAEETTAEVTTISVVAVVAWTEVEEDPGRILSN
jgi:hypothetical protein